MLGRVLAASFAALALVSPSVSAQPYPAKPVRLVVPQTPGGATDVLGRALGQKLSERWGQPVVIENRAGAGGVVGTELVARAAPDGYTLLFTYAGSQAINQSLYPSLPFDSVKDFQTIATVAVVPFVVVVNPKVPATDLREFVALAKARPDELTYASSGNGSVNHLVGEMLKSETGIRVTHVPYKGVGPALNDLLGGQVHATIGSVPSVIGHIQAGSVRALAVTSARRSGAAPDVPTVAEQGIAGFDVNPWWGFLAPAGTPLPLVRRIHAELVEIVGAEEMQAFFRKQGADALLTGPEEFSKLLEDDVRKWAKVVKESGARLD